jgi:hypothetical protein
MLKGLSSEPLPSRGFCLRAGCDEIEPGAQRRHVDALEYPRQEEKASTVERGGHRVLGSEANISAIRCRATLIQLTSQQERCRKPGRR